MNEAEQTALNSLQKTSEESDIEFISAFEMYNKEESGVKPNTLRDIACFDRAKKATHVRIRKGYTKIFFRRKITDVTLWGRNIIISWNPNEDGKCLPADKAVLIEDVEKIFEQEKLYIVDGRYFIPAQDIQVKPIWVLQKLKSLKGK